MPRVQQSCKNINDLYQRLRQKRDALFSNLNVKITLYALTGLYCGTTVTGTLPFLESNVSGSFNGEERPDNLKLL